MDYSENVQRSINYIEQHIKDEIDINLVVKESGYSITHFYRIFQALTGESLKDYIRKRKLSDAAIELKTSGRRLIDIAFDYGFNSQEVFTRAFSKLFLTTPGRYRLNNAKMILYEKANAYQKMLANSGNYIEPKIILDREFKVVGLRKAVKPGDIAIRYLWEEFSIRKLEISNAVLPAASLGICEYMPNITDEDEFDYLAGVEVTDFQSIPDGMVTKLIPKSKYAVFTHQGPIRGLKATYQSIYGVWLPNSDYELAELDTIELYDPKPGCPEDTLDIYIPIR